MFLKQTIMEKINVAICKRSFQVTESMNTTSLFVRKANKKRMTLPQTEEVNRVPFYGSSYGSPFRVLQMILYHVFYLFVNIFCNY